MCLWTYFRLILVETRYVISLRFARFAAFLQNFSERQILWSLCSVGFHAFALKLPIQTALSMTPNSQFLWVQLKLSKFQENEHFPVFHEPAKILNVTWRLTVPSISVGGPSWRGDWDRGGEAGVSWYNFAHICEKPQETENIFIHLAPTWDIRN